MYVRILTFFSLPLFRYIRREVRTQKFDINYFNSCFPTQPRSHRSSLRTHSSSHYSIVYNVCALFLWCHALANPTQRIDVKSGFSRADIIRRIFRVHGRGIPMSQARRRVCVAGAWRVAANIEVEPIFCRAGG